MRKRDTLIGLVLAGALAPAMAAGPAPVPVHVGGEADADACGAVGRVTGLRGGADSFLAVRTGPGVGYGLEDRLHQGDRVFMCESRPGWIGVVYGREGQDCGVASPVSARQPYAGPCAKGWVSDRYVRLEAG